MKLSHEERMALFRNDLPTFAAKCFHIINPGTEFLPSWHHRGMAKPIEDIRQGHAIRQIVNASPRSGKSTFFSSAACAFLLGHDPTLEIIVASHNTNLAIHLSHDFRKIVSHPFYKDVFGHMSGAPDTNNEKTYRTDQGGARYAVSVNSGIVGLGADIIIIDDPITPEDALNPDLCKSTNQWLASSLMTRLNNKTKGSVILVMQRVSIWDTTKFLLDIGGYDLLKLPAKTDKDVSIPLFDGDHHHWKQGELLHPELLPESVLKEQRSCLGSAAYSAQYLQTPIPAGGGAINLSKFKRFTKRPVLRDHTFISIDLASGKQSGSKTAIQVWGYSNRKLYLCGSRNDYLEFPLVVKIVRNAIKTCGADRVLIENAASGHALREALQENYPWGEHPDLIQLITPKGKKTERMDKAMLKVDKGEVYLPTNYDFVPALEEELLGFPEASLDDQVDAMSQVINYVQRMEVPPPEVKVSLVYY